MLGSLLQNKSNSEWLEMFFAINSIGKKKKKSHNSAHLINPFLAPPPSAVTILKLFWGVMFDFT
jgi:hypothetical protein